jgi:hypothetical protein
MPSKKIWLICKYASPDKYFFGTRHFYLAEEWVKNGHDVTIFTSTSSHLTDKLPAFTSSSMVEEIAGVRTVWLNVLRSTKSTSLLRVLSWIHFEWKVLTLSKREFQKPDVIIASSLSLFSIISGFLLSRFYNARFILEIRDIWPLSAIQLGGYRRTHPFMWILGWIERFGYRKSDVIVGTMPNLVEHVRQVEPRYKACVCIPQGIKEELINDYVPLEEKYITETFTPGTFKIVYAGTVNLNNPIEILLDAVAQFSVEERVEAYIVGTGAKLKYYKAKYAFCNRIKFIDPIPKTLVKAFLQQADICFDSIDPELARFGLSRNKWIDYMNAGKPIICSYSGFQSMINEANSGSFVPFGDLDGLIAEIRRYKLYTKEELQLIGIRGMAFLKKKRLFSILAKDFELLF